MMGYCIGDTVLHELFGRGTIVFAEDDMLTVRLDSGETKRFLAPYAPIKLLRSGGVELSDRAKIAILEHIANQNNAIIQRLDRIERMLEDADLDDDLEF